jgi:ankyrin repeat protein
MKPWALVPTQILVLTVLFISGGCTISSLAEKGDYAGVKRFIDAGEDVNALGWYGLTALTWALFYGQTEIAHLLREAGAKEY